MNWWGRVMAGFKAFQKAYVDGGAEHAEKYSEFDARRLRYAIYWAFYENSAYDNVHTYADAYKAQYGLYRYIRNIYNPAYRLTEFWVTHLNGGLLDPAAGDGTMVPSALPIQTPTTNAALRASIARLWRDSNWQERKALWARYGAGLGDVALEVVNDPVRQRVYLQVLHPGLLKDVQMDAYGHVKGYTIEEDRTPTTGTYRQRTIYREVVSRDGDDVVYETFRNDKPHDWTGQGSLWRLPYGFVPLVFTKHLDMGLPWGQPEIKPGLPKVREADDLASKLDDQIRKIIESPWLMAGVADPNDQTKRTAQGQAATTRRPQPGREEMPMYFTTDANAKAQPLVAPIDIAATSEHIHSILKDLERDFPELRTDIATASGDASGRALRVARQGASSKVIMRRPTYDNGEVRGHQMAIAIAGHHGYEGYEAFNLASYHAGQLDHSIGQRPVFAPDPLDDLEVEKEFWTVAGLADEKGYPLELFLEEKGWSKDKIARVVEARKQRQEEAMAIAASKGPQGQQPGQEPDEETEDA